MNKEAGAASNIVAQAVDRGINYFDIAPSYGNAQERLGRLWSPIAPSASWHARPRAA
jgi:aryl-alcohol dehydrogenase-like predicted oxidoreductase